MKLTMACTQAHPAPGEEVMAMDDVDVNVYQASVEYTSDRRERMSNHD